MKKKEIVVYYCNWIKNPHDKILLCVCDQLNWGFWFNSNPAFHGHGQLKVEPADHVSAIYNICYLDLSSIKKMSYQEISQAQSRGTISPAFSAKILCALSNPIKPLPETQRLLACANLI